MNIFDCLRTIRSHHILLCCSLLQSLDGSFKDCSEIPTSGLGHLQYNYTPQLKTRSIYRDFQKLFKKGFINFNFYNLFW